VSLTPEQVALRRTGLAATDMVALVEGRGLDVWLDKTGRAEPVHETARMRAGNKLEPSIASWAAEELGLELGPRGTTVRHPMIEWALATPDYYLGEGLLECKYVKDSEKAKLWGPSGTDEIPERVYTQIQWQMHVAELPVCYVGGLLDPGYEDPEMRTYRFDFDEDCAGDLHDLGERFWRDHVLADVQPPITGSVAAHRWLARKYPTHSTEMIDATPAIEELAAELRNSLTCRRAADECVALFEAKIKEAVGAARGVVGTFGRITVGSCAGRVRYGEVVKALNVPAETLDKYRGAPSSRLYVPRAWGASGEEE
jgi:predicted phage-related endonuclease